MHVESLQKLRGQKDKQGAKALAVATGILAKVLACFLPLLDILPIEQKCILHHAVADRWYLASLTC
jgi:hypothetical protein